jgi:hypothetical protein
LDSGSTASLRVLFGQAVALDTAHQERRQGVSVETAVDDFALNGAIPRLVHRPTVGRVLLQPPTSPR